MIYELDTLKAFVRELKAYTVEVRRDGDAGMEQIAEEVEKLLIKYRDTPLCGLSAGETPLPPYDPNHVPFGPGPGGAVTLVLRKPQRELDAEQEIEWRHLMSPQSLAG